MLQIVQLTLPNFEITQTQINNPSVFVYIERPEWGASRLGGARVRKRVKKISPSLYISYDCFCKEREEKTRLYTVTRLDTRARNER